MEGDLGLAVAMSRPECDGQAITILTSAVDPAAYAELITTRLAEYEGSSYLRTASTCPSLRAQYDDGSDIYVVYFGPFPAQEQACAARALGPQDAYVKMLSPDLPFDHQVSCP